MKVVVNRCFGCFGLSPLAEKEYLKLLGKECYHYKQDFDSKTKNTYVKVNDATSSFITTVTKDFGERFVFDWERDKDAYFYYGNLERTDENLIKVVEMLGDKANGDCAQLEVVEIPDGTQYEIDEYDGKESIHEIHQSW